LIIERIEAENVLKYARLELTDIPDPGLIAVIGDNESGKSSIGESICFALFGRTFSLGPDELDKVIRWGESRCAIKLDFRTPDGGRYQVARFLDELGNHGASISRPGEQPLVRGLDAVAERLKALIGFGYTELIESFYLAQREISTPKPHSDAVKAMAGVDALERVAADCRREAAQTAAQRAETAREHADMAAQVEAIGLDPQRLPTLEREQETAAAALAEDRRRMLALKSDVEQAQDSIARVKEVAAAWLALEPEASYRERRSQSAALATLSDELAVASSADEGTRSARQALSGFADTFLARLDEFDGMRAAAAAYRARLATRLGLPSPGDAPAPGAPPAGSADEPPEPSFAAEIADLDRRSSQAHRGRGWAHSLGLLLALLGLAAALGWFLLIPTPENAPIAPVSEALARWLDTLGAPWRPAMAWVPSVAGALALGSLALLIAGALLGTRRRRLAGQRETVAAERDTAAREHADLGGLDTLSLSNAAALLGRLREPSIAERVPDLAAGPQGDLLDPARYTVLAQEFRRIADELVKTLTRVKAQADQALDALHESVARQAGDMAGREAHIAEERERVRRHRELAAIADGLRAKQDDLDHRLRVRSLAVELLNGAIRYISQRFNTEIRNLSADSLPKFTNGRYQHLQIDQDLKVKAFSNEKRDFMDLDEISSGTQRQIMLAVRMALSQKLVNSVIQGPQMLFLDEPFAFFDETRTASALAVLPQVSPDFTQIWVTSQTFPANSRFDLVIECDVRESRSPRVHRPGD
jgi:recombinational DNA repair ATPase RecF